ncbi:hypothetical protein BC830DRAFT_720006 [Chytriomyces sp. MP71]|nr:hypothetical protein BC830DRAFT_720006 [Chytriomyces sp. MP71]
MAPSSDKKRALLSTVAAISKTLDDTDAEFGTASLPLPRLPTKTVPLNDATTTKPHRNASSIFSDPNVFERVSQSQQHTSNSQPSSRRSSLKNAAPQPRQPPPSQTSTGNLNSSNQQLKETLKHLENENRKLQFEKAALVSTLIDIKPQPQPQPQSQPQRRVIQMGGGSDSAFITGAVVDADRIAGTPNHFHYVAPSEMMQQSLNHPHPPPPQQQYSTFPQPSYSSLPQQSQQQQVYAPRQMQQMQVQPAQSHLQPVLVTGGVVDAVRSLTPNHVHYSVPVETMNILREVRDTA